MTKICDDCIQYARVMDSCDVFMTPIGGQCSGYKKTEPGETPGAPGLPLFCWHDDDYVANGPFDSREAVVAATKDRLSEWGDQEMTVYIGSCNPMRLEDFLDADSMVTQVEQNMEDLEMFDDSCVVTDGAHFTLRRIEGEDASKELRQVLAAWSQKWMEPSGYSMFGAEEEEVCLEEGDEGYEGFEDE